MARRYKELCRLQTQIATRGSETEESYNIVIRGFNKILEDIDASTSTQHLQYSTSSITHNCNDNNIVEGVGIVTGIMHKERVCGSSVRPKNTLEKGKKRKKVVQIQQDSQNSLEFTIALNPSQVHHNARNSSQCDSMLIGDNAAANTYPYIQINSDADVGDLITTSSFVELLEQL
ncbi:Uncharacterized protein Fot_36212 [Forsythia ovata]|uniref:Uncharacterized protein n=1 Tax=Forsythia ovata TaxID=205694 RepID=A0ABD1SQB0_9LAMI